MRLDLFLKTSLLVPRRTIAQELCDAGLISINGTVAKSSREVNEGDQIEIRRRSRVTRLAVSAIPSTKQVSKQAAADLYSLIEETAVDDDLLK